MKKKGFTLIELLIVVAIIAILAAIAVPNFLEAQIRAKISRSKADMRSIATAIRAYEVDNNDNPNRTGTFDVGFFAIQPSIPQLAPWQFPPLLTTPVSYMSSMPFDPFNQLIFRSYTGFEAGLVGAWYTTASIKWGTWTRFNQAWELWPGGQFHWVLATCGPDGQWNTTQDVTTFYYDPTNGTVSSGDIYFYDHIQFTGGASR